MRRDCPQIYGPLVVERNTDWVDQIQVLLKGSGVTFIAIGAGHLVGLTACRP